MLRRCLAIREVNLGGEGAGLATKLHELVLYGMGEGRGLVTYLGRNQFKVDMFRP